MLAGPSTLKRVFGNQPLRTCTCRTVGHSRFVVARSRSLVERVTRRNVLLLSDAAVVGTCDAADCCADIFMP